MAGPTEGLMTQRQVTLLWYMADAAEPSVRGLHSFTSELNLSNSRTHS